MKYLFALLYACLTFSQVPRKLYQEVKLKKDDSFRPPKEFYLQSHQTCLLRVEPGNKILQQGSDCLSVTMYLIQVEKTYELKRSQSMKVKGTDNLPNALSSFASSLGDTLILFLRPNQRDLLNLPLWQKVKFENEDYYLAKTSLAPPFISKPGMDLKDFTKWHHLFVLVKKNNQSDKYVTTHLKKIKVAEENLQLRESKKID
jgi:hypothetical protein